MAVQEVITLKGMKSVAPKADDATLRARAEVKFGITILPYRVILWGKPRDVTVEEVYRVTLQELRKKGSEFFIFAYEVENMDRAFYEASFTDDISYSPRSIVKLWYFYR